MSMEIPDNEGSIIGVLLSADGEAVTIKLSSGIAYTFDARWPDDVMSADPNEFTLPYWRPMTVQTENE